MSIFRCLVHARAKPYLKQEHKFVAGIFLAVSTLLLVAFGVGLFAPNDLNGGSDYPVDVIFYTYLKNYPVLYPALAYSAT